MPRQSGLCHPGILCVQVLLEVVKGSDLWEPFLMENKSQATPFF